jgi:hypothetical protein
LLSGVGNKITLIYESFYITEVLGISPEEIKINLHDFLENPVPDTVRSVDYDSRRI